MVNIENPSRSACEDFLERESVMLKFFTFLLFQNNYTLNEHSQLSFTNVFWLPVLIAYVYTRCLAILLFRRGKNKLRLGASVPTIHCWMCLACAKLEQCGCKQEA